MNKISLIVILMMFTISISVVGENNNTNTFKIDYSFEKPVIKKLQIQDTIYDQILLDGVTSYGNPGEPYLPIKGAYILIPSDKKIIDINVNYNEMKLLGENFQIMPAGESVINSLETISILPEPDLEIYNSNDLFPGTIYSKIGTYIFRGYKILVLDLFPVQYAPKSGEIYYYSKIAVCIETIDENSNSLDVRGLQNDKIEVMKKIDNPSVLNTYKEKIGFKKLSNNYEFLILTTEKFKESFEPLKQKHEEMGIATEIKTLNDIVLIPNTITPEDIRSYIRDQYYNYGINYVLLGGDADIIPARMLYVYGKDEDQWPIETEMPSDFYYGCLDGTFNYDGDELWGEDTDGENGGDVDLFAEVYIGRACVDNEEDISNFVSKTIAYINSNNDEYIKKVLMAGEHLGDYGVASWGGNYLDQLIDVSDLDGYETVGIPQDSFDIEKLYDRDWENNYWSVDEIINRINDGVHIINHDGHSNYGYNMKMSNNDVYFFNNDKYFFSYSTGCNAGGFDNPDDYDCFAEYLTVKTEHGAFAAIMNARYGFFWSYRTDGDSTRFAREFWDAVFNENMPIISKANQDSKEDNIYLIGRSCMRWTYYQLNLFGDPTVAFHISSPPNKPETIEGPLSGKPGTEYTFTTSTTDPEGDDLYYLFDWGDNSNYEWIGPYSSGESIQTTHIWKDDGSYNIRVKARDESGMESIWSDPTNVVIPKNRFYHKNVLIQIVQHFLSLLK